MSLSEDLLAELGLASSQARSGFMSKPDWLVFSIGHHESSEVNTICVKRLA